LLLQIDADPLLLLQIGRIEPGGPQLLDVRTVGPAVYRLLAIGADGQIARSGSFGTAFSVGRPEGIGYPCRRRAAGFGASRPSGAGRPGGGADQLPGLAWPATPAGSATCRSRKTSVSQSTISRLTA
jgi:hypothetical protein